jgi:hypothetical protein
LSGGCADTAALAAPSKTVCDLYARFAPPGTRTSAEPDAEFQAYFARDLRPALAGLHTTNAVLRNGSAQEFGRLVRFDPKKSRVTVRLAGYEDSVDFEFRMVLEENRWVVGDIRFPDPGHGLRESLAPYRPAPLPEDPDPRALYWRARARYGQVLQTMGHSQIWTLYPESKTEAIQADLDRLGKILDPLIDSLVPVPALEGFEREPGNNFLKCAYDFCSAPDGIRLQGEDLSLLLTTRELLNATARDHRGPPALDSLARDGGLYTSAFSTEAFFYRYFEVPVENTGAFSFVRVYAGFYAQDYPFGNAPKALVALAEREGRVVLASADLKNAPESPACKKAWEDAGRPFRGEDEAPVFTECYAREALAPGAFPELLPQAQALLDGIRRVAP